VFSYELGDGVELLARRVELGSPPAVEPSENFHDPVTPRSIAQKSSVTAPTHGRAHAVRTARRIVLAMVTAGCVSSSPQARVPAPRVAAPVSGLPACGPSDVAVLTSYLDAQPGQVYRIDMHRPIPHVPSWQPVDHVAMPMHHASRILFDNLAAYPTVDSHTGPVRFTIRLGQRELEQAEKYLWLATYHAVITDVCLP
jgi:hypothetical protein